jgi:hypothetical protein
MPGWRRRNGFSNRGPIPPEIGHGGHKVSPARPPCRKRIVSRQIVLVTMIADAHALEVVAVRIAMTTDVMRMRTAMYRDIDDGRRCFGIQTIARTDISLRRERRHCQASRADERQ